MTVIALDVMSGDLGAQECVPAALLALASDPDLRLLLVGDPAAIEAGFDTVAIRRGYGRALAWLSQPETALLQYEAVLVRNRLDVKAMNGRGVALDMMGRQDEAQAQYKLALAQAPARQFFKPHAGTLAKSGGAMRAPGTLGGARGRGPAEPGAAVASTLLRVISQT